MLAVRERKGELLLCPPVPDLRRAAIRAVLEEGVLPRVEHRHFRQLLRRSKDAPLLQKQVECAQHAPELLPPESLEQFVVRRVPLEAELVEVVHGPLPEWERQPQTPLHVEQVEKLEEEFQALKEEEQRRVFHVPRLEHEAQLRVRTGAEEEHEAALEPPPRAFQCLHRMSPELLH